MAIQNKIRYAISVVPVEQIADVDGNNHDILASEIGKNLGGSGSALVTLYDGTAAVQGYTNHTVNYLECTDNAAVQISAETGASFVYIRNTGYTYSSATALGASSANSVKVTTVNTGTTTISILDKDECIALKDDNGTLDCTKIKVQTVTSANGAVTTDHLAVEILVVNNT